MSEAHPPDDHPAVRYEAKDFGLGKVLLFLVGLAVVVALVTAFLVWFLGYLQAAYRDAEQAEPRRIRAVRMERELPQLLPNPNPVIELENLRQYEEQILNGTPRPVPDDEQKMSVPVSMAMEMVLERGFPQGWAEGAREGPSGEPMPPQRETAPSGPGATQPEGRSATERQSQEPSSGSGLNATR